MIILNLLIDELSSFATLKTWLKSAELPFFFVGVPTQIKIICDPKSTNTIKDTIAQQTDVIDIIHTGLGGSPRIIDEN